MKDVIAGGISGMAQIVIGYPLDTLKVLSQNNLRLSKLSIKNLYGGVSYPLQSSIITNAVVFSLNKRLKDQGYHSFFNGFLSGALVTPFVYFFDKAKVNTQVGNKINKNVYSSMKGITMTLARETIAFGVYFSSYEYCREKHSIPIPIAGAFAGVCNWTATYPMDVIRNRQIAMDISINKAYNMGSLFKGLDYCLARAVIVNSVAFYVYENVYKHL